MGILALGLCSCRRGAETPESAVEVMKEDVKFTASATGYLTKASDSALEENKDVIGIFALDPIDAINVKGKVVQGGKVEPHSPIKWGLRQSYPTRFAAYMPYDETMTSADYMFYVKQDQKSFDNYEASDLRYAVADTRPGDVVDFRLQHALSKLVVVMEDGSDISAVTTKADIVLGAGLNMVDGSLVPADRKGAVSLGKATEASGGEGFVAILVPQEGLFPLEVTLSSGEKLERTLKEPVKFEPGIAYKAVISVNSVTFRVSIINWVDGGSMQYGRPKPI